MTPRLKTSRSGREFIKGYEGYRREAELLPDGRWVVGYGHTASTRAGASVDYEDAEKLLIYDLLQVETIINDTVFAPLTQNQFDALASFVTSVGGEAFVRSSTLRYLNEGRPLDAAATFDRWRMAQFGEDAIAVDALVRRRAAEKALFLVPAAGPVAAPSPEVPPIEDPSALTPPPGEPVIEVKVDLASAHAADLTGKVGADDESEQADFPGLVSLDDALAPGAASAAAERVADRLARIAPEDPPVVGELNDEQLVEGEAEDDAEPEAPPLVDEDIRTDAANDAASDDAVGGKAEEPALNEIEEPQEDEVLYGRTVRSREALDNWIEEPKGDVGVPAGDEDLAAAEAPALAPLGTEWNKTEVAPAEKKRGGVWAYLLLFLMGVVALAGGGYEILLRNTAGEPVSAWGAATAAVGFVLAMAGLWFMAKRLFGSQKPR